MKGAQVGGTEAGNNWIGYIVHMAPGPMMAVSPTVELAKRNSKQRIEPLLQETPALRERVKPARERDSGNTTLSKEFEGGLLIMTGANSAAGLRSMPARYLFMDEIDAYPGDVGGEGDPILLAERRSVTFRLRRKIFMVSTPTVKGISRVQREFEKAISYFFVLCTKCGHYQHLRFMQLRWPEGKPGRKIRRESCGHLMHNHEKTSLLSKGEWRATLKVDGTVGYHPSSLYSPVGWFSWSDAATLFEEAKRNPDLMKGFVNTVLGELTRNHPKHQNGSAFMSAVRNTAKALCRWAVYSSPLVWTFKRCLEWKWWSGRHKQNWSVDYIIIDGDTARQETWDRLAVEVLDRDWLHESGHSLPIRVMAVDSGYATQDVYAFVRRHPQAVWGGSGARASAPRTVAAVKGRDRDTALILSVSKADTGGKRRELRVWNVSGPVAKMELYRWLKLDWPTDKDLEEGMGHPPGSCHFPQYGEDYFKQLTAEKRIIRVHRGYPRAVWEKDPTRNNEALDCRVYARAAAGIYGLDRFSERHWRRLEEVLGKPIEAAQPQADETDQEESTTLSERLKRRPVQMADDPYL